MIVFFYESIIQAFELFGLWQQVFEALPETCDLLQKLLLGFRVYEDSLTILACIFCVPYTE